MRGIILAAGRGSRLDHKTEDRPKCQVELSGEPLLHWQIGAMRAAGIKRVLVVRGYRGKMIVGDFEVCDNPDWESTNMVGSLMCAGEWLTEDTCIVSYSDIVYDFQAVTHLCTPLGDLCILYDTNWLNLWQERFSDPLSDAESFSVDGEGIIRDIGRKGVSLSEIHGQYMGLLKFTPRSFGWVKEMLSNNKRLREKLDMTTLLSLLIQKGHSIRGVPWGGAWCEVDDLEDLRVAESMVDTGRLSFTPKLKLGGFFR